LRALMGDVRDAMSDVVDHRSLQQLVLDARNLERKRKRAVATGRRRPAAKPR
jgi:DNA-binding IscR family transcriptional regulator